MNFCQKQKTKNPYWYIFRFIKRKQKKKRENFWFLYYFILFFLILYKLNHNFHLSSHCHIVTLIKEKKLIKIIIIIIVWVWWELTRLGLLCNHIDCAGIFVIFFLCVRYDFSSFLKIHQKEWISRFTSKSVSLGLNYSLMTKKMTMWQLYI